jgi:hypothetical protein
MSVSCRRICLACVPALWALLWWTAAPSSRPGEAVRELHVARIEPAPLCPWRQPADDLRAWFPDATGYHTETRILSGQRLALARRLGRTPDADESALQIHRVSQGSLPAGAVLTRRVKGDNGAIEIVVGVTEEGRVRGVRLQRLREPEAVREELERPDWLGAFRGMELGGDGTFKLPVPDLTSDARVSAAAVVDGVRSLLALYATARETPPSLVRHHG